ncbi:chitosanase [Lentilactobacillus sp. SPB1-3]|uniref:Chitosanase n=1 Tax=Lentilactobacillus terminaliae TaxID=3003483 RepID=A0ACD5DDK1_9LACO|nr:chitosanase [Lentilactobacillus sp. SPB1-3]MCZ0977702.1 chitosanase [Lentilactobacillus sp. SPB1-3]
MKKILLAFACVLLVLTGCAAKQSLKKDSKTQPQTIQTGNLRKTTFALVSSAENSTLNYNKEYRYIEDIGDGRGYTGGIIGFTSGTGDMYEVVKKYVQLKPQHNILKPFLPALKAVNGTSSHKGLGNKYVTAWRKASKDSAMIKAQNDILDKQYMNPAIKYAKKDGLSPLGQYIYYDALVVHGPGKDSDHSSFQGILADTLKKCKTPAQGGNEAKYLKHFLKVRTKIMLSEAAHKDLSRLNVQRKFINEGKFDLQLPLSWTMYNQKYYLDGQQVKKLN